MNDTIEIEWELDFPDETEVSLDEFNIKTRREAEQLGRKHGAIAVVRVKHNLETDDFTLRRYKIKGRRQKPLPSQLVHAHCNVCGEVLEVPVDGQRLYMDNRGKDKAFDFQFTHGLMHGADNCVETWVRYDRLHPDRVIPLLRYVEVYQKGGFSICHGVPMGAPDPPPKDEDDNELRRSV
jgi:hypothetical protein